MKSQIKVQKTAETPAIRQSPQGEQPNIKLRVACYCRVGNKGQIDSLELQKQHFMQKIAEKPSWEMAGVYSDEGISGIQIQNRAGFMQMLRDCQHGKIDLILTASVSRFARNTVDACRCIAFLREQGVGVIFEKERIDTRSIEHRLPSFSGDLPFCGLMGDLKPVEV